MTDRVQKQADPDAGSTAIAVVYCTVLGAIMLVGGIKTILENNAKIEKQWHGR